MKPSIPSLRHRVKSEYIKLLGLSYGAPIYLGSNLVGQHRIVVTNHASPFVNSQIVLSSTYTPVFVL